MAAATACLRGDLTVRERALVAAYTAVLRDREGLRALRRAEGWETALSDDFEGCRT